MRRTSSSSGFDGFNSDLDLNQPWFLDEEELEEDQTHDFSSGDEVYDDELLVPSIWAMGTCFDGTTINRATTYPFDLNMEPPETKQHQNTETVMRTKFPNFRQHYTYTQAAGRNLAKIGYNCSLFGQQLIRKRDSHLHKGVLTSGSCSTVLKGCISSFDCLMGIGKRGRNQVGIDIGCN